MAEQLDIEGLFKLKVDELKQELGKRSLSKSGSKAELQERLLQHVTTHDGSAIIQHFQVDPIGEEIKVGMDDMLDKSVKPYKGLSADTDSVDGFIDCTPNSTSDDISVTDVNDTSNNVVVDTVDDIVVDKNDDEIVTPCSDDKVCEGIAEKDSPANEVGKPIISSIKSITPLSDNGKKESRSKRFGASSEVERKKARLDRFSATDDTSVELDDEKIKKRKERFGTVTSVSLNSDGNSSDRLKKRQERFADVTIKKRQERFGVIQKETIGVTTDAESRKQRRLLKFGAVV